MPGPSQPSTHYPYKLHPLGCQRCRPSRPPNAQQCRPIRWPTTTINCLENCRLASAPHSQSPHRSMLSIFYLHTDDDAVDSNRDGCLSEKWFKNEEENDKITRWRAKYFLVLNRFPCSSCTYFGQTLCCVHFHTNQIESHTNKNSWKQTCFDRFACRAYFVLR